MKQPLLIFSVGFAIALSAFYAETAVVYSEGEQIEGLMVKPSPSLGWRFGGGEDHAWERSHPGRPKPWWLDERRPMLVTGSPEEVGSRWWETPYRLGLLPLPVLWAALGLTFVARALRRGRV